MVSREAAVWPLESLQALWGVPPPAHFPRPQGYRHGNPGYSTHEGWRRLLGETWTALKLVSGHLLHPYRQKTTRWFVIRCRP